MSGNNYKTIDGLMRHLRHNGIEISGSRQKNLLINSGYYHGYKGYRYFKIPSRRLPFSSFQEIYSTIEYDTKLKSLLYSKIMFIETALKNISLITTLDYINSNTLQDLYSKAIISYKNCPSNTPEETKKKYQFNKLNLQKIIQNSISRAYERNNPKITHFYNSTKHTEVPLWAIFEILTMGDFGYLLSCLTIELREKISRAIGINLSTDTNRVLIYKYVYALKDLRNAIAHNNIVYDTRFQKMDPNTPMKMCLKNEFHLPYVNFKSIDDYIFLICYFLKLLHTSKKEIKSFIRKYEKITQTYVNSVNPSITQITLHPSHSYRMDIFKKSI